MTDQEVGTIQDREADRIAKKIDDSTLKTTLVGFGMCFLGPICPPIGVIGAGLFVGGLLRAFKNEGKAPRDYR